MSLDSLKPLIKKVGSNYSPKEFHNAVNVTFHDIESELYDQLHSDMKLSLQDEVDLLVSDILNHLNQNENKRLLDIGCGTGLSTAFILNSELGNLIKHATLLDTSEKMLQHAENRIKSFELPYTCIRGTIDELKNNSFDIIMVSSVLHHIPQLIPFLKALEDILNDGGVLLHIQDPNADYADDQEFLDRKKQYLRFMKKKSNPYIKFPVLKPLKKKLKQILGRKDYIDRVNDRLRREGVIQKNMTADEIWSVTDIHVRSDLNPDHKGISLKFLEHNFSQLQLISSRSYGFFGPLKNDLADYFLKQEEEFSSLNKMNGRNLSCAWIKKSNS